MDRWVSQQFRMGGTAALLHKYIGPVEISKEGDATVPNYTELGGATELSIQDLFFLENRDRVYDENVYELRGVYQINDHDFDLTQFGIFLPNDTLYISFHTNDVVDMIGRKLMSGDVIELPHLRDDLLLDPNRPAINKYYVISDVNREASGYAQTWWSHTIRVKVEPMTDSQEFNDILDRESEENAGLTIRDILSTYNEEIKISDAIADQAEVEVPERYFQTAHLYVFPGEENGTQYPWIFAGDGEPPNGAELLGSGNYFPPAPQEGDWFLRTDYMPNVLFRRVGDIWCRQEADWRGRWSAANYVLESFINNDNDAEYSDGTTHKEKTALSKAIKPKVDL